MKRAAATVLTLAATVVTFAEAAAAQDRDTRTAPVGPDAPPAAPDIAKTPTVPSGFRITAFADDLPAPEWMAFGPEGALYVSLGATGQVVELRDDDGDGWAETRRTVASGFERILGMAWRDPELWVSEGHRIVRVRPDTGTMDHEVVVATIGNRVLRALRFTPAGDVLFIAATACDTCRAEGNGGRVLRYDPAAGAEDDWAAGVARPVALAIDPVTGELWATDGGEGAENDPVPPSELNIVARHGHYGWPYCYAFRMPHPRFADPDRCDLTEVPVMLLPGRSGPTSIEFYTGELFSPDYRGDALVVLGGSDAPGLAIAPRVLRVRMDERRRPVGVETFVGGWVGEGGRAWGRPVQSLVGPGGAVYVSDALGRKIWRIVPTGSPAGTEAPAGE